MQAYRPCYLAMYRYVSYIYLARSIQVGVRIVLVSIQVLRVALTIQKFLQCLQAVVALPKRLLHLFLFF